MPPEHKRIIQSREGEPDSAGSWAGAAIFFVVTVGPFLVVLLTMNRHTSPLTLLPFGALALAGIVGLLSKMLGASDVVTIGPLLLEVEPPGPADDRHWRATLRLPGTLSAAATVHAELLCSNVHNEYGDQAEQDLVWGKGLSVGVRWVYGEGTAALSFEIPPGLPRSETWDPNAKRGRMFGKWELKVTAGSTVRNYDLDIQPAAGAFGAESAAEIIARAKAGPAAIDTPEEEAADLPSNASSVALLVAANLVLIAGIVFWSWRVRDVALLYWIENLVVGAFNVAALLIAVPKQLAWLTRQGLAPSESGLLAGKICLAGFFVLHFGFFCYVHGELLAALFLSDGLMEADTTIWRMLTTTLRDPHALLAIAAIAISHGYSFFHNYVGRGEYRNADLNMLMTRPYRRIAVTSVLILGGIFLLATDGSLAFVVALVAIKTVLDIVAHVAERRALSAEPRGRGLFDGIKFP